MQYLNLIGRWRHLKQKAGKLIQPKVGIVGTGAPSAPHFASQLCSMPGQCNICGQITEFYYRDGEAYRESLLCRNCLTTSRYRSLANGVLRAVLDLAGVQAES